ncbi:MAG: ATP phosphoribosyltransferase [Bifidobacteriaceae bacterium]|jgi:ATP phosphoribosyltransferase|nr:ATP phosphoribosyltransferase [Bifidobacteriaceae bacterium]
MLRVAVPNKGSLAEPAAELLKAAGYRGRRDTRELVALDSLNDVEFFFLRPRDVALYVGSGTVDAGITGRDLLLDSGTKAVEVAELGFGHSTFRFAAPSQSVSDLAGIAGQRVATSYPGLVGDYLAKRQITPACVTRLDGAVESAIRLGVADVVADVVSTGSTLRAAGLAVFGEPILHSQALLIRRPTLSAAAEADLAVMSRRIKGVLLARQYVLMDYDVPIGAVERAVAITPGLESPTVSPLHNHQWVAVRAMVPKADTNKLMDQLYEVGARAILVTAIHACRI